MNKKSYFNPCVINVKISSTELTTILLAYLPSALITHLIVPFSYVISTATLQRNTNCWNKGKNMSTLTLEVIKQSTITPWVVPLLVSLNSDIVGFVLQLLPCKSL